jgi:hypothetical protein
VSRHEYLDTAFASRGEHDPGLEDIYGYSPVANDPLETGSVAGYGYVSPREEPRVIIIESDDQTGFDDDDNGALDLDVPGNRNWYQSDVRNQLEDMEREMLEIQARAGLKGGAGRAAIDSSVRDFNDAREVIKQNMYGIDPDQDKITRYGIDRIQDEDRSVMVARIDAALREARVAVYKAEEAVRAVPDFDGVLIPPG